MNLFPYISSLFLLCSILQASAQGKAGKHFPKKALLPKNATRLSKEVYRKLYQVMRYSRAFRNYTLEEAVDFINEVDEWTAPEELANRFPYYLGGYDDEDRPVWYSEAGKYKIDDLIDRAFELYPVFEKMIFQVAIHVAESFVGGDKPGKEIRQGVVVIDCAGFDVKLVYKLVGHLELIELGIKLADLYLDILVYAVGQVILLNANYATKMLLELVRPIYGEIMGRVVALSGNKYRWKAELKRILPEEAIPTWYGGSEDFKPLAVYG